MQDDHQRINHFRNHYELTRKDLLVKNVKRMKKQMERENRYAEADNYEFVPLSFALPGDYSAFFFVSCLFIPDDYHPPTSQSTAHGNCV